MAISLEKHGNRPNSPFPRATGNPVNKNIQGQFHLDDILTHPKQRTFIDSKRGLEMYAPDGRGAYFREDGSFRGFVEEQWRN